MKEKKYIVYMHINNANQKIYIGQTCQKPESRWGGNGRNYLKTNKSGKYMHDHFARAILKYGWNNFEHIIVAEGLSLEESNQLERDLIVYYDTMNPKCGYNSVSGGSNRRVCCMETINKLKQSHAGKMTGDQHPNHRQVICLETKEIFGSTLEADRKMSVARGSVWMAVTERCHTIKNLHFMYLEIYKTKDQEEIVKYINSHPYVDEAKLISANKCKRKVVDLITGAIYESLIDYNRLGTIKSFSGLYNNLHMDMSNPRKRVSYLDDLSEEEKQIYVRKFT